jgi:hypothetical protein
VSDRVEGSGWSVMPARAYAGTGRAASVERPVGFEPTISGIEVSWPIQLAYGRRYAISVCT